MSRLLTHGLIAAAFAAAGAAETEPGFLSVEFDGARLRGPYAAHPVAAAWRLGSVPLLRSAFGPGFADALVAALAESGRGRLDAGAAGDRIAWSGRVELPGTAQALAAAINALRPDAVRGERGTLLFGDAPRAFDAAAQPWRVTFSPARGFAAAHEDSSAGFFSAIGLDWIVWGGTGSGDALDERVAFPGFKPPLARIDGAALVDLGSEALAAWAVGIDGRGLSAQVGRLAGSPGIAMAAEVYHRRLEGELGPLPGLLAGLDGTITAQLVSRPMVPAFSITFPAGGSWDVLAQRIVRQAGFGPAVGRSDAWVLTLPKGGAWPELHLARAQGRWRLSSEQALVAAPSLPAPAWAAAWPTTVFASRLATAEAARQTAVYARLPTMGLGDPRRQMVLSRVAGVAEGVAASRWPDAEALGRLDAQGLVLSGRSALLAAAPALFLVAAAGGAGLGGAVAEGRRPETEDALRVAAHDPTPRILVAPPLPTPWIADGRWGVVVGGDDGAAADLPVAVSAPGMSLGEISWLDAGGRTHHRGLAEAGPLWKAAMRLVEAGRHGTEADWAPIFAQFRRQDHGDKPAVTGVENWQVFPMPSRWRQASPAEIGKAPWRALWFTPRQDLAVGLIGEACDREDSALVTLLRESALRNTASLGKVTPMWERPVGLDCMPAVRMRHDVEARSGRMTFERIICARRGWAYQLVAWGAQRDAAEVAKALDELAARFEAVDHARPSPEQIELRPAGLIAEPRLPVDIPLEGSGWRMRPDPSLANQHAVATLYHPPSQTWAVLCPADLGGRRCSDAALLAGLLGLVNQPYPDPAVVGVLPCTVAGGQGLEAGFVRGDTGQRFVFQVRAVRLGDTALLLATWRRESVPADDAPVTALIAGLRAMPGRQVLPSPAAAQAVSGIVAQWYVGKELWADAWPWAEAAALAAPTDSKAVNRALLALARQERYGDALAWFQAHARIAAEDDLPLASWEAWLLARSGQRDRAITVYEALLTRGLDTDDDFADLVDQLRAAGRTEDGWKAFARFPRVGGSAAGNRLHVKLLHADQRDDEAAALLHAAAAKDPGEGAQLELASGLETIGRNAEAQELLAKLLAVRPGLQRGWRLRGIAEHRLGWYREALASLRHALDLDPSDADATRWEKAVRDELGHGDGSSIARPLATVEIADPPQPVAAPASPQPGATWLLREERIRWTSAGELVRTQRRTVLLADASACEDFATITLSFEPRNEDLYVNALAVAAPGGRAEDHLRREDCYVVDDPDSPGDGDQRRVRIPAPGLVPGCTLDWTITRREHRKLPPWLHVPMWSQSPCLRSVFTITGDLDGLAVSPVSAPALRSTAGCLRAELGPQPAVRGEALTDPSWRDLPAVDVGPRNGSWSDLGKEYLAEIADRVRPDPTLAAEAGRICPDGTADPAGTLLEHVSRTITYRAVEFGTRARMPRPAAEVRALAQGDCKDHAVLLLQLLQARGIPAHLALVPRDGFLDRAKPHLDQFDHMVVVSGTGDGLRVLDATVKRHDPGLLPAGLGDADLLVLDPAGPRLWTAPPRGESGIASERTVRVAPDGAMAVEERVVFTGYLASSLRSRCAGLGDDDLRSRMRGMLDATAASVEKASVEGLEKPSVPAVLHLVWTPRARLQAQAGQLVGSLPEPWAEWLLRVPPEPRRTRTLACLYGLAVTARSTVVADRASARIVAPAPPDRERFFTWEGGLQGTVWSAAIHQGVGRWPASDFTDWQRRCAEVCDRAALRLTVAPAP